VKELTRYAKRVVLAFDADNAGQNAAARFYAWERDLDIAVAVAALPPGVDPADLGREDPAALAATVDGARPFLEFRLERLFGAADLRSAEGRARAAEGAVALVAEHPNDLVRDQYLMQIADRCQVDVGRLRGRLAALPVGVPSPRRTEPARRAPRERERSPQERGAGDEPWPEEPPPGWDDADAGWRGDDAQERRPADRRAGAAGRRDGTPPVSPVERQGLVLLVHRPDDVAGLLQPVLFGPVARAALDAVARAGGDLGAATALVPPGTADLLLRVAVEEPEDDPVPTAAQLVVDAAKRVAAELDAAARAAVVVGGTGWEEHSRASHWLRQEADRLWSLREARHLALGDLAELVAWLTAYDAVAVGTGEEGTVHG
jgi:DNA primase